MTLGPLVAKKNGTFTLVGITSVGMPCDSYDISIDRKNQEMYPEYYDDLPEADTKNIPNDSKFGAYTNVASCVSWIIQNSDYNGCQLRKYPQSTNFKLRLLIGMFK